MFHSIIIVGEGTARVIGWINEDTLYFPRKLLLQRLQCQQVIAKDQPVVENVLVRHPMFRMIGLFRVFQQNARLQLGPVFFPDPGEFQFLVFAHCTLCFYV